MGLKDAGATFQRLMELVLAGVDTKRCLVYLDDIIISSETEDEHLSTLRDVFGRIRAAKLKLKPQNCRLARREVTFLGHRITQLLPNPTNIQKVLDWEQPKTEDEMKSFHGVVWILQPFCPALHGTYKATQGGKSGGRPLVMDCRGG